MKRIIYIFVSVFVFVLILGSCKDQKDIYQEWVKPGGYVYPERATGLTSNSGYNRALIKWAYPKDPAVTHGTLYWSSRTDSINIDYSLYVGQDSIKVYVPNLREQSYGFEVVNYDKEGNISVPSEEIVSPYAGIWLATHAERQINGAEMNGTDAVVNTGFGTDEMIETEYRYVNTEGDTVVLPEKQGLSTASIILPNAAVGTRFQFHSSYCPSNGIDTVWNEWRTAALPIAGFISPKSEWTVTTNTTNATDPNKIFDGVIGTGNHTGNAWWGRNNVYPKIVQIDLQKEYMVNRFRLWQNRDNSLVLRTLNNVSAYLSNKPFNMNATFASDRTTTDPTFTHALYNSSTIFWNGTSNWNRALGGYFSVRYMAIVIFNSRRNGSAIQELEFYGYEIPEEE